VSAHNPPGRILVDVDQRPGNRLWWAPFAVPLVLVAVVIGAVLLPVWLFVTLGAILLLIGVPLALRIVVGQIPTFQLPPWLPGGRPGNR
jgi:hypothetical protein